MEYLSNKVLITGISGFTGIYLKEFLERKGYIVYGLSNKEDNSNPFIFSCDITKKESISKVLNEIKPNYIIHLAAISFVQHEDLLEIYNVNILGTQNILDSSIEIKKHLKKIILASSATVYGNQKDTNLSEDLCPNPVNHYGISKLAMEQVAKNYYSQLPVIITRPFNYTGFGQDIKFIIPKIAHAFTSKSKTIELGNINTFREYNSIDFICEAYYKLLVSDITSEVFNLCSGKTYSLNEILELFSKKTNHKIEVVINPKFVRENEIEILSGNPEKLSKILKIENNFENIIASFLNK